MTVEIKMDWVGHQRNRRIVCPTIMHSGSRILRYRVLEDFDKLEFHLTECKRFKDELNIFQIFTSLRHPARIRESFARREALRRKSRYPYNQEYFDLQWREMIDNISKRDPFYLHVDDDCRDAEVGLMEDYFKKELPRNWEFVEDTSTAGTHDLPIEDCPEVPQEYIDFYYSTMPGEENANTAAV